MLGLLQHNNTGGFVAAASYAVVGSSIVLSSNNSDKDPFELVELLETDCITTQIKCRDWFLWHNLPTAGADTFYRSEADACSSFMNVVACFHTSSSLIR
ncbi:hypothetical protein ABBQ38_013668 [Trebouxia sp. C0009 RCD-2024]